MSNSFVFSNNAGSTLAGAITNTSITLNLAAGGGALFPNPSAGQQFAITAIDAATGLLREIMYCTARSTDTLTVVRAQEGTTGLNWNAGDLIQSLWTAGQCAAMLQQGNLSVYYGATDTGSADAMAFTLTPTFTSYAANQVFYITKGSSSNATTTPTFNGSGVGAKTVTDRLGNAVAAGDLPGSAELVLFYDGTHLRNLGIVAADVARLQATLHTRTNLQQTVFATRTALAQTQSGFVTLFSGTYTKLSATSTLIFKVQIPIFVANAITAGPSIIQVDMGGTTRSQPSSNNQTSQASGVATLEDQVAGVAAGSVSWSVLLGRPDATTWGGTANPNSSDTSIYPSGSTIRSILNIEEYT